MYHEYKKSFDVAAYMRCSGLSQVDGDTWIRQLENIQNCAARDGCFVRYTFHETAVPGKYEIGDRPVFQEMIAKLLETDCRKIMVESLERLAREYRIQEQIIIYLASKGFELFAANTDENITAAMMGDPMRRAMVQIQGIFAELDKNLIVAKLKKARQRIRTEGRKDDPTNRRCEGRKPYGSTLNEKEVIAKMRVMHGAGYSLAMIAAKLNQVMIRPRKGMYWHSATIGRILRRNNG
jgi:site-specific DNA recombinase